MFKIKVAPIQIVHITSLYLFIESDLLAFGDTQHFFKQNSLYIFFIFEPSDTSKSQFINYTISYCRVLEIFLEI